MQRKLKSVFRKSSKSRGSSGQSEQLKSNNHHAEPSPPRGDKHRVSSDRRGRASVDSSATGSVYTSRSRPVSSIYDSPQSQAFVRHTPAGDSASSSDPNGGAISNDYKAYLPVLSPVNDDHGDEYVTISGAGRQLTGESEVRHEEDVADRNIARYSNSTNSSNRREPASNLIPGRQHLRRASIGQDVVTNGGLTDGIRLHTETASHEKRSSIPIKTTRVEPGWEGRKPRTSNDDNRGSHSLQDATVAQGSQADVHYANMEGSANGEETALAKKLREDGVVDLRNTVDTDGEITWAPAVTHEVIKPHQHEIIQHKIYREIHNYEHFHRIQPVVMTEVLPPRHWIPNPDGEGLIEISADELPARTGENRWWSICEHSSPYSRQTTIPKYRTEPEIIEAGTFMTEGGYERRETIIIHPPTLADLTGYGGPVQPMHFDHKTGKSWMGELTTMEKLQTLQQELDRAPDARQFNMDGLAESLPKVSSDSTRRGSNSIPARKPISGYSPTVRGSNVGRKMVAT